MAPGATMLRLQSLAALDKQYTARISDYLRLRTQRHGMTAAWREKICDWYVGLARSFDLDRETVGRAERGDAFER